MTCSRNFFTFDEEKTKKRAKNLSEKIILEKIGTKTKEVNDVQHKFFNQVTIDEELDISNSNVDSLITELDLAMKINETKTDELFSKIAKQNLTNRLQENNEGNDFDFIEKLQKIYKSKIMKYFEKRLKNIIKSCESSLNGSEDDKKCLDTNEPMNLLEEILNDLNINCLIEHNVIDNLYDCMIVLKTKPNTSILGFGETKKIAEILAIQQVAREMLIFLTF